MRRTACRQQLGEVPLHREDRRQRRVLEDVRGVAGEELHAPPLEPLLRLREALAVASSAHFTSARSVALALSSSGLATAT
jgi:hypothetical protein